MDRRTDGWTDGQTDGQGDYYRALPTLSGGALITQQILRKTRLKFEEVVTFGNGQIMTLTFDINVASLNHLV